MTFRELALLFISLYELICIRPRPIAKFYTSQSIQSINSKIITKCIKTEENFLLDFRNDWFMCF